MCEKDDVISNTIGFLIRYVIYFLIRVLLVLFKSIKKKGDNKENG